MVSPGARRERGTRPRACRAAWKSPRHVGSIGGTVRAFLGSRPGRATGMHGAGMAGRGSTEFTGPAVVPAMATASSNLGTPDPVKFRPDRGGSPTSESERVKDGPREPQTGGSPVRPLAPFGIARAVAAVPRIATTGAPRDPIFPVPGTYSSAECQEARRGPHAGDKGIRVSDDEASGLWSVVRRLTKSFGRTA